VTEMHPDCCMYSRSARLIGARVAPESVATSRQSSSGVERIMTRSAFLASGIGKGLLTFALGTLTVLCGVDVHSMPALGAGLLTIVLSVYFFLDGVLEIAASFVLTGGTWLVFAAAISFLSASPAGRSTRSPSVRSTGPGSAKRQTTGKNRG
jgi:hypothetical protein